jgi:hypothetical protein
MFRVADAAAATAIGFDGEAWARILAAADRVVVARLLGGVPESENLGKFRAL